MWDDEPLVTFVTTNLLLLGGYKVIKVFEVLPDIFAEAITRVYCWIPSSSCVSFLCLDFIYFAFFNYEKNKEKVYNITNNK